MFRIRVTAVACVSLVLGLTACTNHSQEVEALLSRPLEAIAPVNNTSMEVIRSCNRPAGSGVLMSFDDEGTPDQVKAILDRLRHHHMRAAFFPTGEWAEQHLDLIDEMKAEGHIVGSHTYTHARLGELSAADPDEFYSEVYPLENVATTDPMLLRPPYEDGAYDELVGERLTEKNTQMCTWTADSHDWDGSSVEQIMYRLEHGDRFTEPLDADGVVLAHLSGEHSPALIDALVEYLDREGMPYEQLTPVS